MMSKLTKIFIITLLSCVVSVPQAEAIQKLEFPDPISTLPKNIEKIKEEIEQKYTEAMETLNGKIRKALSGEGAALFSQLVNNRGANVISDLARGQFNVGDFSLTSISNAVVAQMGEFKLDLANLSAMTEDYAKALEEAKVTRTKMMNAELIKLDAEREAVNTALMDDPTNEALLTKLNDLDINLANLQGQIDQAMAEDVLADKKLENYRQEISTLMAQIDGISAEKVSEDFLKSLNEKVAGLFPTQDNEDVRDIYATNIYKLFLGEYDNIGGENMMRVKKARNQEYYEALKNLAREYLNTRNDVEKSSERSQNCLDALGKADGISGQQTMQICADLQNARAAAGQASLLLARLRFRAIETIQGWHDKYKLVDYSKDPTVLNLDDYIFTKKDLKFNAKYKVKQAISNFKGF